MFPNEIAERIFKIRKKEGEFSLDEQIKKTYNDKAVKILCRYSSVG